MPEISVKDVILKVKEIVTILLKKGNIAIMFLAVSAFFVVSLLTRPPMVYVAETTMMIKNSGGMGLFSGVASAFDLGDGEEISYEKVVGITLSNKAITNVLMSEVEIEGEKDIMVHHMLNAREDREEYFAKLKKRNIDLKVKSYQRDSVMRNIIKKTRDKITIEENREKLIVIKTTFNSEELAYVFNNTMIDYLVEYFQESMVKGDLNTKRVIENRLDSVRVALFAEEQRFANMTDNQLNVVKRVGLLEQMRSKRQVKILNEIYGELIKQREIINFKVLDNPPSLDVVDAPVMPLNAERKSLAMILVLSTFGGTVLSVMGILFFHYYKDLKEYLSEV